VGELLQKALDEDFDSTPCSGVEFYMAAILISGMKHIYLGMHYYYQLCFENQK